jgi:hypothetical protein
MSTYEDWINERPHYRELFPTPEEVEVYRRRFVMNTFMPNNQPENNAGTAREMTATERMIAAADQLQREVREVRATANHPIRQDAVLEPVDWDEVPMPTTTLRQPRPRTLRRPLVQTEPIPVPPPTTPWPQPVATQGRPFVDEDPFQDQPYYTEPPPAPTPYKTATEADHFL